MTKAFAMILALLALAHLARGDTYHTPLDPRRGGGIRGLVQSPPPETLQTVIAVEPTELKAYQARVDASSGAFVFQGLPPGEYDLLIKTVGHVYEGLTLELDGATGIDPGIEPAKIPGTPAARDLAEITRQVGATFFAQEDYFNLKRIVRLCGTPPSAADKGRVRLFAVQVRTRPVVDPAGDAVLANVRRFDLVDLERAPGANMVWQMVSSRHLLRQEVPYGDADNILRHTYSPRLGGILVGNRMKDLGVIELARLPPGPKDAYGHAEHEAP